MNVVFLNGQLFHEMTMGIKTLLLPVCLYVPCDSLLDISLHVLFSFIHLSPVSYERMGSNRCGIILKLILSL